MVLFVLYVVQTFEFVDLKSYRVTIKTKPSAVLVHNPFFFFHMICKQIQEFIFFFSEKVCSIKIAQFCYDFAPPFG